MDVTEKGSSQPKRERHPILTLEKGSKWRSKNAQLGGVEQLEHSDSKPKTQSEQLTVAQFEAALWDARNSWDIKRRSGLFAPRGLRKDEADQALRRALQSMVGGAGR